MSAPILNAIACGATIVLALISIDRRLPGWAGVYAGLAAANGLMLTLKLTGAF